MSELSSGTALRSKLSRHATVVANTKKKNADDSVSWVTPLSRRPLLDVDEDMSAPSREPSSNNGTFRPIAVLRCAERPCMKRRDPIRTSATATRSALRCVHFLLFLLLHLLLVFLGSIMMRLDGEKHARAQHQELERTEDHRDPKIHHFLKTLRRQLHVLREGQARPNGRWP